MRTPSEARYAFLVEWLDTASAIVKQYQLIHFAADGTLEMFDIKNRRTFLKRCDYPSVKTADLYIGNIVTVYGRQLTIKDYGDEYTASVFVKKAEMTVAYVPSTALADLGKVLDVVEQEFLIAELRLLGPSAGLSAVVGDAALAASLSAGPFVAMKLCAEDAVGKLAGMLPADSPVKGSATGSSAVTEADYFFGSSPRPAPTEVENSSLLLVRPHAVRDRKLGAIVAMLIESGFACNSMAMVQLSRPNAQEFFEVYKGVVPEYADWVDEIVAGKCVAIQAMFKSQPQDSVPALRELCGAHDPEIASHLHTSSLRALFGESKIKNAVHCTDLPEDGPLEVDYFFTLL